MQSGPGRMNVVNNTNLIGCCERVRLVDALRDKVQAPRRCDRETGPGSTKCCSPQRTGFPEPAAALPVSHISNINILFDAEDFVVGSPFLWLALVRVVGS